MILKNKTTGDLDYITRTMPIKFESDRVTGKDVDTYKKKRTQRNKMAPGRSHTSDFVKQNHR